MDLGHDATGAATLAVASPIPLVSATAGMVQHGSGLLHSAADADCYRVILAAGQEIQVQVGFVPDSWTWPLGAPSTWAIGFQKYLLVGGVASTHGLASGNYGGSANTHYGYVGSLGANAGDAPGEYALCVINAYGDADPVGAAGYGPYGFAVIYP